MKTTVTRKEMNTVRIARRNGNGVIVGRTHVGETVGPASFAEEPSIYLPPADVSVAAVRAARKSLHERA